MITIIDYFETTNSVGEAFNMLTLQGDIEMVPCEPYVYEIPESGERITLEHTWEYNPEPVSTEEHVFAGMEAE